MYSCVCVCGCVVSIQSQPKVFSAGLDITEMYGKSPERCGEFWRAVQEMWLKLYGSNMITIAAINVRQHHRQQEIGESNIWHISPIANLVTPSAGFQSCRRLSHVSDV